MLLPFGIRVLLDPFELFFGDCMLPCIAERLGGVFDSITAAAFAPSRWLLVGGSVLIKRVIKVIVLNELGKRIMFWCLLNILCGLHLLTLFFIRLRIFDLPLLLRAASLWRAVVLCEAAFTVHLPALRACLIFGALLA